MMWLAWCATEASGTSFRVSYKEIIVPKFDPEYDKKMRAELGRQKAMDARPKPKPAPVEPVAPAKRKIKPIQDRIEVGMRGRKKL